MAVINPACCSNTGREGSLDAGDHPDSAAVFPSASRSAPAEQQLPSASTHSRPSYSRPSHHVTWQLPAHSHHGGWHITGCHEKLRAELTAAEGPAGRGGTRQGSDAAVPSAQRCVPPAKAAPCFHHTATAASRQQSQEHQPGGTAPGSMPERPDARSIPSTPAPSEDGRVASPGRPPRHQYHRNGGGRKSQKGGGPPP